MISSPSDVRGQHIQSELAELLRGSFHSKHPDDPFLKWRRPDGAFKVWLHTFAFFHSGDDYRSKLTTPWAPVPWVWDERPSQDFIYAMYNVGLLKKIPGDWARFRPLTARLLDNYMHRHMYGVLLPYNVEEPLKLHLLKLRRGSLNENEFMQKLEDRYVLFK